MDYLSEHLIKLSDQLDQQDKTKCADAVDLLLQQRSLHKLAQYVGIIGYVLKQNRALGNCIRKKRVASNNSMQEVVLDCLKEYQDGQEYGTNDWTKKYAQVIHEAPESFDSSFLEYFKAIEAENNLDEHIQLAKKAHRLLKENDCEDEILRNIVQDIEKVGSVLSKEGDGDHRPFKLAAPPSPRSTWSRIWNWRQDSGDEDLRYEMERILENIMGITQEASQITANLDEIEYTSRNMNDPNLSRQIHAFSHDLQTGNWNLIDQIYQKHIRGLSGSPKEVQNALGNIRPSIYRIQSYISSLQEDMANIRMRDAIKGRAEGSALTQEYSDLYNVLKVVYRNPLNEKALYHAQRKHGELQNALNIRPSVKDPSFQNWISEQQSIPSASMPEPTENVHTDWQQIVQGMALNARETAMLNSVLNKLVLTPIPNEMRSNIRELLDALNRSNPTTAHRRLNIPKISAFLNKADQELALLVQKYVEQHKEDEEILEFPQTSSILKE